LRRDQSEWLPAGYRVILPGMMRLMYYIFVALCLSTRLLAVDAQITEKSGKVRSVKNLGMLPAALTWHDGDSTVSLQLDQITAFKVKFAGYVKERKQWVYRLVITLKSGKEMNAEVDPVVFSWRDGSVDYQLPLEKVAAVSFAEN
jgi:transcriptional antiterminator Rof (Rho-off)